MYGINEKQDLEMLRREGFTEPVIARLYKLRRAYGTSEMDQAALDTRRLEFIRWLVRMGKLTDQIP